MQMPSSQNGAHARGAVRFVVFIGQFGNFAQSVCGRGLAAPFVGRWFNQNERPSLQMLRFKNVDVKKRQRSG